MNKFQCKLLPDRIGANLRMRNLSARYGNAVSRILATTTERCLLLRCQPSLEEVMRQMSIRSVLTEDNTLRVEVHAMRKFFAEILAMKAAADQAALAPFPGDLAPVSMLLPEWFDDQDWHDLEIFERNLRETAASQMRARGVRELSPMIRALSADGFTETRAERAYRLAGLSCGSLAADARRPPQKRWNDLNERTLSRLMDGLPFGSTGCAMQAISNWDTGFPGVARLLSRTAWITGMRCAELFRCQIMQPGTRFGNRKEALRTILTDPVRAFKDALLEDLPSGNLGSPDASMAGTTEVARTRNIRVLIIHSVKTRCSSPGIDNSVRAQLLIGIPRDHLECLTAVSRLRSMNLSRRRRDLIAKSCNASLRAASTELFPHLPDPVTLHSFRHAFADDVRRCLGPEAAAALTGHTSTTTLRGYGGKRRPGSHGPPGRWLPRPDSARVEEIRTAWNPDSCGPSLSTEPVSPGEGCLPD